jgi:HlyD family secretion protein
MQKIKNFIIAHKFASVVAIAVLILGGYLSFRTKAVAETRYVTSTVTTGTVVVSVTGSGQVAASNEINLMPKVSGNVTYVGVNPGNVVKKGKTLFSIDATDAQKAVRDAQTNLDQAKLALTKLQEPADPLSVIQTQDAIDQATTDKTNQDLAVKNAYAALLNANPEAVPTNTATATNFTAPVISGNYTLGQEGDINLDVHSSGKSNGYFSISGLVSGIGTISTVDPQPIGTSGLYIEFPSIDQTVTQWTISIPNVKASNYLSAYNAYQDAQQSYQNAIDADNRTIAENTEKLKQLQTGADVVDIQTQELNVTKAQNALLDAQTALNDYYILAPFDGVVATVVGQVGQPASSGTALGTIITNEKIASITLNEVDVAKIKLGQKATLTFDAIDGLSIAGTVASIDTVGTVTQGVVNYTVKIAFDTQDDRVKPGMSVSAAIITDVAQDVLTVPASAIKTSNGSSYVQMFDTPLPGSDAPTGVVSAIPPRQQPVVVGLSDDTTTQITSGLKEGDQVVSRTITSTTTSKTATSSAPSLLGGSRGGGGGGAFRAIGG